MNTFLLIDTATPVCSVALSHAGEIVYAHCELQPEGGHASRAGVLVEDALQAMQHLGLRLDAVGLSAGPGSYTGLRIGSSLAKGLCHGYGIPLVAVSTLEMMAEAYRSTTATIQPEDKLIPMIDARRQEVYTATFDAEGRRLSPDHAQIVSREVYFDDEMPEAVGLYHFFGDGVDKPEGVSAGRFVLNADLRPEAKYMLPAVERAYANGLFVDTAYWTPSYLKEYVAQISRNKVLG